MKIKFLGMIVLLAGICGYAQKVYQDNTIRIPLWAERDAYPGLFDTDTADTSWDEKDKRYSVPVSMLKKVGPFLVGGMVYGWKYDYTPYDKTRGVEEYFSFEPIQEFSKEEELRIRYVKPWIEVNRLYCWVEYDRTEYQKFNFDLWSSVTNPKIRGFGYARLTEGFDGIQKACGEAMKNAVREHWRKLVKNKPKEITGRLLICEPPAIGIDSGRYIVTLDFFMESDKIIEYKTF